MDPEEPKQISNRERMRSMVKKTLSFNFCPQVFSDQSPSSPTKTELSNVQDPKSFENYYTFMNKIG